MTVSEPQPLRAREPNATNDGPESRPRHLQVRLRPARIGVWAISLTLALGAISFLVRITGAESNDNLPSLVRGVAERFDLELKKSVGTWFSAVLFLACSGVATLLLWHERQLRSGRWFYWFVLAAALAGLSLNEIAGLHEILSSEVRGGLRAGGTTRLVWLMGGGLAVAAVVAFAVAFLKPLDGQSRWLFVIAGGTFVVGAVTLEVAAGWLVRNWGFYDPIYILVSTIEETFELLGPAILLYALLDYMQRGAASLSIEVRDR